MFQLGADRSGCVLPPRSQSMGHRRICHRVRPTADNHLERAYRVIGSTDWLEIRISLCDFAGDRRFLCDPLAPIFYLG